jgi:hypothetical protein
MGKNGRRLAEKEYDRDDLGDQFVDVLESLAVK